MIRYYKLYDLLVRRGLGRMEVVKITSPATAAKLRKGENVETETIDKICAALGVQPGDIMEYIPDKTKE